MVFSNIWAGCRKKEILPVGEWFVQRGRERCPQRSIGKFDLDGQIFRIADKKLRPRRAAVEELPSIGWGGEQFTEIPDTFQMGSQVCSHDDQRQQKDNAEGSDAV